MGTQDRFRGALLGLAVGDAVGTTLEFQARGTFAPLTDMIGGGPFRLEPGQWTDDTSMALCLATSLVERVGFDPKDQMDRYVRWATQGYLSSTGTCFDIGNTVSDALRRYERTGNPFAGSTDPYSAGNGSIMRLAPVALAYYPDMEVIEGYAAESSRTTHGAEECLDACRLLGRALGRALAGQGKSEVLLGDAESFCGAASIVNIAQGAYRQKTRDDIRGTGYVVKSLEAALCCVDRTETFRDAVLLAANLGDDADTTAAIVGQVAGALYGVDGIPEGWLAKLAMRDEIVALADQLLTLPVGTDQRDGEPT